MRMLSDSDSPTAMSIQSAKYSTDLTNLPTSLPPTSPSTDLDEAVARRKHTAKIQARMRARYKPYRPRLASPPLELRFTSRAIGDTSYIDLGLDDVVEVCVFPLVES